MTARKLITIEGEKRVYTDGVWVVFTRDGFPCGVMNADAASADDPVKAARAYWESSSEAIAKLAAGYRIELTTQQRWRDQYLPIHLGEVPWRGAARIEDVPVAGGAL